MRLILALMTVTALICSCRNDPGDEDLKWSCATVQSSGSGIATPECYEQLQRTQSPVLKHYKAIAKTADDGRVDHYLLVQKSDAKDPAAAAASSSTSPTLQLKVSKNSSSEIAPEEKRN